MTVGSTGPQRTRAPVPPEPVEGRHRRPAGPSDLADDLLAAWAGQPVPALPPPRPAAARRWPWRVGVLGVVCLLIAAGAVIALHQVSDSLGDQVTRVPDVFASIEPATRPPAAGTSTTFLLVGTDTWDGTRPPDDPGARGAPNSDVLMIARLSADRSTAAVASIPRSSWVDIPGRGFGKISSAYALGGAPLLVRTVENLTQIRIDHLAVIDFSGFRTMVDAVGGIDLPAVAPPAGPDHLDGLQTLTYVRVHGLADGDLERSRRQQDVLRALFTRVAATGMLSDPAATYRLLDAASRAVSVDDSLTNSGLRAIVAALDDLGPAAVTFVRAPVAALGRDGVHPPVYLDPRRSADLWRALRADRAADYGRANPADTVGATTP